MVTLNRGEFLILTLKTALSPRGAQKPRRAWDHVLFLFQSWRNSRNTSQACLLDRTRFSNGVNKSRWDKVRHKVGLESFKFHDLRKTFGSVLAQNGISTVVIQKLLEHSSPDLTNKVYMNVDPVLRQAIDTIPAGGWLRVRLVGKKKKDTE